MARPYWVPEAWPGDPADTCSLPPDILARIARHGSIGTDCDGDPNAYELAYAFAEYDARLAAQAAASDAWRAYQRARRLPPGPWYDELVEQARTEWVAALDAIPPWRYTRPGAP